MTFLDISNRWAVKHNKNEFRRRWRHLAAKFYNQSIELTQLVGGRYNDFNSYLQPFSHFRVIFYDLLKNYSRNIPILGAFVEELLESYQVGIMTLIRISNRLVMLSKWAQMVPPPLPPAPAYAFHEFAYAVGELKMTARADPSSPSVDASHHMVLINITQK